MTSDQSLVEELRDFARYHRENDRSDSADVCDRAAARIEYLQNLIHLADMVRITWGLKDGVAVQSSISTPGGIHDICREYDEERAVKDETR